MKNSRYSAAKKFLYFLTILGAGLPSVAHAQVTVDMSRVTCAEYLAMSPDQSATFSAWMSGYFNQKGGYVWVDLNQYAQNVANVKQWCANYPRETVLVGLERATKK